MATAQAIAIPPTVALEPLDTLRERWIAAKANHDRVEAHNVMTLIDRELDKRNG